MSVIKKGGEEEGPSQAQQEAEQKEAAAVNMHTAAKVAFRGAEWKAREGERSAEQAKRPMKDMPQGAPPTGDGAHNPGAVMADGSVRTESDDGDDGEGDGSSGKGGSSSGGISPDMAIDDGYTSFADGYTESKAEKKAEVKKIVDDGPKKQDAAEKKTETKVDAKKGPDGKTVTAPAPTAAAPKTSAPSAPSAGPKSGGTSGPGVGGPG